MSQSMPWQAYLVVGFVILFVGGILLIFLYAFLEAWWLSRQSLPCRFEKLKTERDFDNSALPRIAVELGMKQVTGLPERIAGQVLDGMPHDWKGAQFRDTLIRESSDGLYLLSNVSRANEVMVGDSSGERQTTRYLEVESVTLSAFIQEAKRHLPAFVTRPFLDYLIVRLVKLLAGNRSGQPLFTRDPEFHRRLLITTAEPEKVRLVLTQQARNVLKENNDLTTSVAGPAIVVQDDGHPVKHGIRKGPKDGERVENCKVIAANDWPRFFHAAENIFTALKLRNQSM